MRLKLLVIGVVGMMFALPARAATKVALVTSYHDKVSEKWVALTEPALSQEAGLVLVERGEIDKVLGEQAKSSRGLMDSGQAVTVGRILGVELFVVLETAADTKNERGAMVVYDAGSGVRLLDKVLPAENLDQITAAVVAGVKEADRKRAQRGAGLLTVGLAAVRNADLPSELDSVCGTVGLLVERELVRSPSLAVLERKRLEHVNKERALPSGQANQTLLASLVTLELELSKGPGAKEIVVKALLTEAQGRRLETVIVTGKQEAVGVLAQELTKRICAVLNTVAVNPLAGDAEWEARRFDREAEFLQAQGDLVGAMEAAEAGFALDPRNTKLAWNLTHHLVRAAMNLQKTRADLPQTARWARRAIEIAYNLRQQEIARGEEIHFILGDKISGNKGTEHHPANMVEWDLLMSYAYALVKPFATANDPEAQQIFRELRQREHDLTINLVVKTAVRGISAQTKTALEEPLCVMIDTSELYAGSVQEWTDDTVELVTGYMKMVKTHPTSMGWNAVGPRMLAWLARQIQGTARVGRDGWTLRPQDRERIRQLFVEMETHPNPVLQCYGQIGQFSYDTAGQTTQSLEMTTRYQNVQEFVRSRIANPYAHSPAGYLKLIKSKNKSNVSPEIYETAWCYFAASDLIDLMPDPDFRKREHFAQFDFMAARRDLEPWTSLVACEAENHRFKHYMEPGKNCDNTTAQPVFGFEPVTFTPDECKLLARNIDRTLELYQSGQTRQVQVQQFINRAHGTFEDQIAQMRKDLSEAQPNLITKVQAPWTAAKRVFAPQNQTILSVQPEGDAIFVELAGNDKIEILRMSLDGAKRTIVNSGGEPGRWAYDGTLSQGRFCVPTDKGIFVLPVDGTAVTHLTKSDGLPADVVESCVYLDGSVYASLKGGYIIRYDMTTKQCRVLVSCRRREKQSPLDDLSPFFRVPNMIADPPRHRVLFLTCFPGGTYNFGPQGLWELDTRTGEFKQRIEVYFHPFWMNQDRNNQLVIWNINDESIYNGKNGGAHNEVALFNLDSNLALNLAVSERRHGGPGLPLTPQTVVVNNFMASPMVTANGWLWFKFSGDYEQLARASLQDGRVEYLPELPDQKGVWQTLNYLPATHQILASTHNDLWLLTLPPAAASTNLTTTTTSPPPPTKSAPVRKKPRKRP